jgi:hypothetical protein
VTKKSLEKVNEKMRKRLRQIVAFETVFLFQLFGGHFAIKVHTVFKFFKSWQDS